MDAGKPLRERVGLLGNGHSYGKRISRLLLALSKAADLGELSQGDILRLNAVTGDLKRRYVDRASLSR